MRLKAVSGIMLTLLLMGMLILTFNIQPVEATGTIYIRADGSIDPPTANITTVDNVTYTFTGNIYYEIVVERDNIVVDGAGYTFRRTGNETGGIGIELSHRSNVTIKSMEIKAYEDLREFDYGIYLYLSSNNIISGNNITANNEAGITLVGSSSNNIISGNNITNNWNGIWLEDSSNNIISGNNIIAISHWVTWGIGVSSNNNTVSGNNIRYYAFGIILWDSLNNRVSGNNITNSLLFGIWLRGSSSNSIIYHNNFIDNDVQASIEEFSSNNTWDDGYPSGGNYWSDYEERYPDARELDGSGVWDAPYAINKNNTDHYPLMYPWGAPPSYTLAVYSSPTGVMFTVDGVPRTTPWSETYSENASVVLEMPETHGGYVWSHWLEDGDTNSTKIVTMDTNMILTGVFTFLADLNGDGIVDIDDVFISALAFGSFPGHQNWNPLADLTSDGLVDIDDVILVALYFGETVLT